MMWFSWLHQATNLQLTLGQFAAEYEEVGVKLGTSMSVAIDLSQESVESPLRVGDESLPKVGEFKYVGVLFTGEGRMELEIETLQHLH